MTAPIKHILTLAIITITIFACGKKEKELTPEQIQARADSILKTKMDKLRRQAKEDLERRLPIELKPKVDSIMNVSHAVEPVPVFPEDETAPGLNTDTTSASTKSDIKKQTKDTVKK